MVGREAWPLLGTVIDGRDTYEIRSGPDPVTLWRDNHQVGYVTAYEVEMAQKGRVPHVAIDRKTFPTLPPSHFRLRQAVGELVRTPDPAAVIDIGNLEKSPR